MIKIAVIGVGRWGRNLVSNFNRVAEVAAVSFNNSTETAAWMKEHFPSISVLSYDAILADKTIQGVVIATPPAAHLETAKKALEAGKEVFVEKPAGTSAEETAMLVESAKKYKRVLLVGYVYLYHPAWLKIKQLLSERGEIIDRLEMSWFKWGTFDIPLEDNLLCHDISLALSAFPGLTSCRVVSRSGTETPVDDMKTEFAIDGRTVATSRINRTSKEKKKTVRVIGTKGSVLSWEDDLLFEETGTRQSVEIEAIRSLEVECREFIRAIQTKHENEVNGELALRVRRLLDSIKA